MPGIEEFFEDGADRLSSLSDDDRVVPSLSMDNQMPNVVQNRQPDLSGEDFVQQFLGEQEKNEQEEKEMSEVELRLEEANWYRALLSNSLFNSGGPIAEKVEAEVRAFVKSRLRILLGLEAEKKAQAPVFSDAEVLALRGLAARITGNKPPQVIQQKVQPQVNQARAPVAPKAVEKVETPQTVNISKPAVKPQVDKTPKQNKKKFKQKVTFPNGETKEVELDDVKQVGAQPRSIDQIQDIANMAAAKAALDSNQPVGGLLGQLINIGSK